MAPISPINTAPAQPKTPELSPEEQRHYEIADAIEQANQDPAEQPKRYAGKYNSEEELERAYKELEKKLGQLTAQQRKGAQEDEEDPSDGQEVGEPQDEGEEPLEDQQDASGEDEDDEEEVTPLSPAQQKEIFDSIGGEEVYNKAVEWASESYSPEERATFNAILDTQDPNLISMALRDLTNRYNAQADKQGQLYRGREGAPGPKPFRSREEMARAMGDFRYQDDPAYREEVAERVAATSDAVIYG